MTEDENFSLEVLAIKENEDGSATLTVEMGPSAAQYFIELGILTTLKKVLADLEKPEAT